jgi:hypothetical protein
MFDHLVRCAAQRYLTSDHGRRNTPRGARKSPHGVESETPPLLLIGEAAIKRGSIYARSTASVAASQLSASRDSAQSTGILVLLALYFPKHFALSPE